MNPSASETCAGTFLLHTWTVSDAGDLEDWCLLWDDRAGRLSRHCVSGGTQGNAGKALLPEAGVRPLPSPAQARLIERLTGACALDLQRRNRQQREAPNLGDLKVGTPVVFRHSGGTGDHRYAAAERGTVFWVGAPNSSGRIGVELRNAGGEKRRLFADLEAVGMDLPPMSTEEAQLRGLLAAAAHYEGWEIARVSPLAPDTAARVRGARTALEDLLTPEFSEGTPSQELPTEPPRSPKSVEPEF